MSDDKLWATILSPVPKPSSEPEVIDRDWLTAPGAGCAIENELIAAMIFAKRKDCLRKAMASEPPTPTRH
jgi:hypothetical protein